MDIKKALLRLLRSKSSRAKHKEMLERRLEQQELMSVISQSFISTEDMKTLVGRALQMAGDFMGIGKILFARYDEAEKALVPNYEWYSQTNPCPVQERTVVPCVPGATEYEAFIVQKLPYVALNDISQHEEYKYARAHGLKSLLGAPLLVFGEFWGMLSFGACTEVREWSESDIQLVRLLSGVIAGVVERNIRDEQLRRMSAIVDASPQYIAYVNKDGEFEYLNKGAMAHTGYSEEELMAGGLGLMFDKDVYEKAVNEITPAILANKTHEFELPMRRKDGQIRLMSFSGFTVDGQTGIGAIASDITVQRQMERDIIAAKELAESSNQAKSEFLSRMSHEMRTPMNAIIGMAAIGLGTDESQKKHYCLKKIDDASTHLLGVINDILDMSKIEANKFELSPTEFAFEQMLMRVLTVTNFRVEEKKQQLNVNIAPNMPYSIVADEQRLAQVIANLLSNATKFTPEHNSISINAELLDETDGLCAIRIAVTDTGIGIAKEQQSRLFGYFEQVDGSISRKYGGTGLGLAISKRIVELMGGNISVESEEGQGSTFSFVIRVRRGSQTRKALLAPGINTKNLNILVVDASQRVRDYFMGVAEALEISCHTAKDAESAHKLIQDTAAASFNVIFIAEEIFGSGELKQLVNSNNVVFMAAQTQWEEAEQKARAAGTSRFIHKPPFSGPIIKQINDVMTQGQGSEGPLNSAGGLTPGCFAGHKLLLAEDVEVNQEIVITLLEDSGIAIDCAFNGREAVEKFQAAPGSYSAILMDIHMPEVDGYEATRQIRALDTPEAKTVPIIAMTANVFKEDIEHSLACGMNDHIGKPIDIAVLFEKLSAICQSLS